MTDSCRSIVKKSCLYNRDNLALDSMVIFDQCYSESDYLDGINYIGKSSKPMGIVSSANLLLDWFYHSDFDYGFYIDADCKVSNASTNDLLTVLDALKSGKLDRCDAIFATMNLWPSTARGYYKQQCDYFENVHIIPISFGRSYNNMNGLIFKNFSKFYNQKIKIDERCNPKTGVYEDIYFSKQLKALFSCYLMPTVAIDTGDAKSSTWQPENNNYSYDPADHEVIDRLRLESILKYNLRDFSKSRVKQEIVLQRVDEKRDCMRAYKKRGPDKQAFIGVDLFS